MDVWGYKSSLQEIKKYPSELLGALFINCSPHAVEQSSAHPCRKHSQCTEKGEGMWNWKVYAR